MMRLTTRHSPPEYRPSRHYPLAHWGMTLLLAPAMLHLIDYLIGIKSHVMDGLLELYPFALIFSIIFSIPSLLVNYIAYRLLSKTCLHPILVKVLLICLAIAGLYITCVNLGGSLMSHIFNSYGLTLILVGFLLPIASKKAL